MAAQTTSARRSNSAAKALSVFENRLLRVEVDARDVSWRITEKTTGVVWQMARSSEQDVVVEDANKVRRSVALASSTDKTLEPARSGHPGVRLRLRDLGLAIQLHLEGRSLVVDVERLSAWGPAKVRDLLFPRHFLIPRRPDNSTTWTVGQGSIVPATMRSRFHHPEGYSEQEMAWHGAFIDGCGMIAIALTPFDLYIAMSHLEGEAPSAFVHWLASMGDLQYTRRLRYTFEKGLNFVRQAKIYREHMKCEGHWVSLVQKAAQNANVAKLKGAVVINSATATRQMRTFQYTMNSFADQAAWATALREKTGLRNAIVHVDGWGRFGYDSVHPETLPPNAEAGGAAALAAFRQKIKEAGWLFALHDQYIDIYHDAPSYSPSRLMLNENGRPNQVNVWAGGLCSHLCISESLKFVRRNFVEGVRDQYMYHNSPSVYAICQPDAYYLDCFCRIHECHNPEHRLTRAQTAYYTNESLRTVRNHGKGVVLQCEHPKFWAVQDLDFAWGLGHLTADVQIVGGGSHTETIGIPVPLWHLVFHDALWVPRYTPALGLQMLYGEGCYLDNTRQGPTSAEIAHARRICAMNAVVGFDEMMDFKIIGDGVYQSEFESDVRVMFNQKESTLKIKGPKGIATQGEEQL